MSVKLSKYGDKYYYKPTEMIIMKSDKDQQKISKPYELFEKPKINREKLIFDEINQVWKYISIEK